MNLKCPDWEVDDVVLEHGSGLRALSNMSDSEATLYPSIPPIPIKPLVRTQFGRGEICDAKNDEQHSRAQDGEARAAT